MFLICWSIPVASLALLSFVPQCVHLREGHLRERSSLLDGMLFDVVEAADELGIGMLERRVGIEMIEACGVDYAEEEVAQLFR